MTRIQIKNNLPFLQRVEELYGQNERTVFSKNSTSVKIVISNFGIYYSKKNWLRNKSTIQFYPCQTIESVHYSTQGWLLPQLIIEIFIQGRTDSFEGKSTPDPIRIYLKSESKEQSDALFSFCKSMVVNR